MDAVGGQAGRRVVVTGLGLATALGLEVEQNWRKALAGVSGVCSIELGWAKKSPVRAAAMVCEADWRTIGAEFPSEAQSEGERRTLFALWAARKALQDARVEHGGQDCARFGVALGAGLGVNRLEDISRWLSNDKKFDVLRFSQAQAGQIERDSVIRNNSSAPASLIARKFGLTGFNTTVTAACASATLALGSAYRAIQRGQADVVVAGGADSMINPVGLVFFVLLGSAAVSPAEPQSLCRPFDRKRSGLVMGEGAGMAVLEEESRAVARGARIYAEVAGFASTMDAWRLTAPHPEGAGAQRCMSLALDDAGMLPEQIDYINAHGTSTKLNDAAETSAIRNLFRSPPPVSSSKSMIGHLLAGSGGPEFAFTVLSVAQDRIHPTINLSSPDPKCDLDYVANTGREKVVRAALSNSFGFGGQNATIVVKKYCGQGCP